MFIIIFISGSSRLGLCRKRKQAACQSSSPGVESPVQGTPRGLRAFSDDPRRVIEGKAWRRGNTRGRVSATLWTLGSALGLGASLVFARDEPIAPALPTAPVLIPKVDDALHAYADVDRALRSWSPPEKLSGAFRGASVQLRLDGEVVGRGKAITDTDGDALTPALRAAMREARERLKLPPDALEFERLRESAGRMLLSLEVAGELVPISPGSFSELDESLSPAVVGVAARRGDATAGVFPLEMLAFGQTASGAMHSCVSKVTGDPALVLHPVLGTPGRIARDHAVSYSKFRTVQVVQTDVGAKPLVVHRGMLMYPRSRLTMAELAAWETGLLGHMTERLKDPDVALADRALSVLAICESALDERAARTAVEGLRHAATTAGTPDMGESAIFLIAAAHARERLGDASLGESLYAAACRKVLAGVRPLDGAWAAAVPQSLRGMIVYALIADGEAERERRTAEPLLRAVYRDAGAGGVIGHMPWVGWAEVKLAGGGAVKAAQALRDARDLLLEAQFTEERAGEDDADMTGGLVFAGKRLPTWDSARPLALLADMACDSRFTDEKERLVQVGRVMRTLRFLRQLTVDESSAWLYSERGARWGVRGAAWEKPQPLPASAMTLLALARMRKGLESQK